MAKPITSTPFQAMEDEAYHAFREWPIFLVMRQKELDMHLSAVTPLSTPPNATSAAPDDTPIVNNEETNAE